MSTENQNSDAELQRLTNQAAGIDQAIEAEQVGDFQPGTAPALIGLEVLPPVADELADMLDLVALAGSTLLPTVPQHFNHGQNKKIADAAVKLADRYGYDIRGNLLNSESTVFLVVGLVFAVGTPARACYLDYKALKEKEVKEVQADKPAPAPGDAERVVTVGD